ncbi:MAG: DNA modification methylase, partial [Deltaproteobacteria bacterium]|nr:DNA modification methylase [Deltaproteobacteria bacterium]
GERRLKAHEKLGREEIEVKYLEDLTDIQKKEIELEENIQRKELDWQEQVLAKLQLHELRQEMYGNRTGHTGGEGWGIGDTATALDQSAGTVSMDLQLARAIQSFPELRKEKSKTTAFKKYKQLQTVLLRQELNKRRKKDVVPNIIHGDAAIETKKWGDETFDFFLTDPPFGIDLNKKADTGKNVSNVDYDDDPYKIMELLRVVSRELYRALKPDRHMIMAFSMTHYVELKKILEEAGFFVDPTPLIWNKISGSTPSNGEYFPYAYEPAFWCMKGRRGLNSTACNMFTYKRVPHKLKRHPLERPQGLLVSMLEAISFPGELGGDPFGGGGSMLEACMSTSRECVIVEKDEQNYFAIVDRWKDINEKQIKKKSEVENV